MYRNLNKNIENWFKSKERKPLVLRGARQVGKSTLVKLFCQENNINLFEINFEITQLKTLQTLQGFELEKVIAEIEVLCKKTFNQKNSLIFFDEIQAAPVALQALRYFYETKKNIAIISAGSLLEFLLDDNTYSMPVGRIDFLHMGPMTFFEFLDAMGEQELLKKLNILDFSSWSIYHEKTSKLLREYYFVGGMPEAIAVYRNSRSILAVKKVHRSLLQTYKADFGKYKSRIDIAKISLGFENLPHCLGKKIKFTHFLPDEKSATSANILELFARSRMITKCFHTNANKLPLSGTKDEKVFKIFFLDIGLMHHQLGLDEDDLIYKNIDQERNIITEGLSAEQFIAQHLAQGDTPEDSPELFYWLKDKKNENAEVDFIYSRKKILPIEVKSGKIGSIKSLISLMGQNNLDQAIRFDLKERTEGQILEQVNSKIGNAQTQIESKFQLINLPLYMIESLPKILDKLALVSLEEKV